MMWALEYMLGEVDWEQLDFFESPKRLWIGPIFWPSNETDPEKVPQEFYNSLQRKVTARVIGHYEKEGDKWLLIPCK